MKNENEIIILEKKRELKTLFTPTGIDAIIDEVEKEVESFVPDMTTQEGRDKIRSFARKIATTKTTLDGFRKSSTEEMRNQVALVNKEGKRAWEALEGLQKKVRKPLTEFEEREDKRIEGCKQRIAEIESFKSLRDVPIDQFNEATKKVNGLFKYDWNEFDFKACAVVEETLTYLEEEKAKTIKQEVERVELEKLRKEKEEAEEKERQRVIKENEERIARESAEKARKEAEEKALKDKQKAEQEVKEREDKLVAEKEVLEIEKAEIKRKVYEAKKKAVEEEKARVEAERTKALEEAAKKAENTRHRKKIHNEILEDLMNVKSEFQPTVDVEYYKTVIKAIAKDGIRNLSIKY